MKMIFRNPDEYQKEMNISEDTHLVYFISEKRKEDVLKMNINVTDGASLRITYIDFAPSDIDADFEVSLNEGTSAEISLACLNSSCKKIYRFNVYHNGMTSYSRTKMGGINSGNGVMKFLGSSFIKNGAHKCDTRQEGKITNLSADCKSEVSPALLIKENDVKASHGAALGAYNPDHLFYLMSRGLTMEESKRLVTYGSLLPMIESCEDEKLIEEAKEALGALTI